MPVQMLCKLPSASATHRGITGNTYGTGRQETPRADTTCPPRPKSGLWPQQQNRPMLGLDGPSRAQSTGRMQAVVAPAACLCLGQHGEMWPPNAADST